jgi:hypothetical protein
LVDVDEVSFVKREILAIHDWLEFFYNNKPKRSKPLAASYLPGFSQSNRTYNKRLVPGDQLNFTGGGLCPEIIGGLSSAFFDLAWTIRFAVDFHHAIHVLPELLGCHLISSYAVRHSYRFNFLPLIEQTLPTESSGLSNPLQVYQPKGASGFVTVDGFPGRLGNWLFRVATAMAVAWDSNRKILLPNRLPCLTEALQSPPCTFLGSFLAAVPRVSNIEGTALTSTHPNPGISIAHTADEFFSTPSLSA